MAEDAKGSTKEAAGDVSDNEKMQAEGKTDQTKADANQGGEKVEDARNDAITMSEFTRTEATEEDSTKYLASVSACSLREPDRFSFGLYLTLAKVVTGHPAL